MGDLVASLEDLETFASLPAAERRLTPALGGLIAEMAVYGHLRYEWAKVQPLLQFQLREIVQDYEDPADDVGPGRSLMQGEAPDKALARLQAALAAFTGPPFTLQRLAELLLEPRKQYSQMHKLVYALEKVLDVTTPQTQQEPQRPRPRLSELTSVNELPRTALLTSC